MRTQAHFHKRLGVRQSRSRKAVRTLELLHSFARLCVPPSGGMTLEISSLDQGLLNLSGARRAESMSWRAPGRVPGTPAQAGQADAPASTAQAPADVAISSPEDRGS